MLVKAAPGLALRDPATMLRIPDEGIEVPDHSPLWNRMLADGDVVRADAPQRDAEPAPAPEARHEPSPTPEHAEPAPEPELDAEHALDEEIH